MMDTYAQGGRQDKATKEALTFVKQKVDAVADGGLLSSAKRP